MWVRARKCNREGGWRNKKRMDKKRDSETERKDVKVNGCSWIHFLIHIFSNAGMVNTHKQCSIAEQMSPLDFRVVGGMVLKLWVEKFLLLPPCLYLTLINSRVIQNCAKQKGRVWSSDFGAYQPVANIRSPTWHSKKPSLNNRIKNALSWVYLSFFFCFVFLAAEAVIITYTFIIIFILM